MLYIRDLIQYSVDSSETIIRAMQKIEQNKSKLVFVVDDKNYLIGSLADGDIRRWAIENGDQPLSSVFAGEICNRELVKRDLAVEEKELTAIFSNGVDLVPLVDSKGHLKMIASRAKKFIHIDGRRISEEDPAYVIAEIGNNHQGSVDIAKQLVDLSIPSGVDCVKFQMRDMKSLYGEGIDSEHDQQDLGSQYTIDLLNKYQLTNNELVEVFDYCKSKNVTPLCTPWDLKSLAFLEEYGMPAYKVASADFTNFELLDALAETGKPLICSTGMATEDEIRYSVEFLNSKKAQFVLLHCNSTYPTPDKDVNLNYLERLREIGQCIVGYSGHERGWVIANSSVILGAKVIEKHFTLDRNLEGNDHKVSLLPDELTAMMSDLRRIEESLGCKDARVITQGELMNREVLAKSLHASMDIEKGSIFHKDMFVVRAPGNGIQPNKLADICGKASHRGISKGSIIYESDLIGFVSGKSKYSFTRPYGIPVRYHDYERLTKNKELDFVEFHLSYSDLSIEPTDFIQGTKKRFVTVHAPELFENDHLLDLASSDQGYRLESVQHLSRVVEHCRKIKSCFDQETVLLVLNAGGWSVDDFVEDVKKAGMYSRIEESLALIDLSGIELSIQTMPPYPWHFGGQSHHNLFVRAEEIAQFCKKTGFKICMDVSHTMMACNYHDDNLYQFMEEVSEYINYFHVVDAKGVDGEGIQIGQGDVDFSRLSALLDKLCKNVPFIPEVWQGHTNQGEGFWKALAFLENKGL